MKSYFLAPIASRADAIAALNIVLPGQTGTWLLKDDKGDTIAYFSLDESENEPPGLTIQADISGRHYNRDADVISVLETLKQAIGGEITDDL